MCVVGHELVLGLLVGECRKMEAGLRCAMWQKDERK